MDYEDEKNWEAFKRISIKTSVEGFVAATNSLYSMPENVNNTLKNTNYKIFGIVGEGDEVFMRLMHKMKEEMPTFELRIIKDSDHWSIAYTLMNCLRPLRNSWRKYINSILTLECLSEAIITTIIRFSTSKKFEQVIIIKHR